MSDDPIPIYSHEPLDAQIEITSADQASTRVLTPTQQQPDREGGELVERLRATDWSGKADGRPCDRGTTCWHRNPDGPEAATHIEDLTRRLAEAEERADKFVKFTCVGAELLIAMETIADLVFDLLPHQHVEAMLAVGKMQGIAANAIAYAPAREEWPFAAPKVSAEKAERDLKP